MAQQIPEGYVLVPITPTPEMIAAGDEVEDLYLRGTPETWGKVYRAMVSAAQQAEPAPAQDEPLADRMRAAGMMTVDEMLRGAPLDSFIRHAGVHDLDTYGQWLDMKCREFLTMQAKRDLNKDPEDDMYEWVIAHAAVFQEARINFNAARPAQTEQQQALAQQILDLITDECRYWQGRDEARRGGFASLYAKAKEVVDKATPQPEQDDSLNMEPEGANAYLVVDPDDNYHVCYVVRSKGQALQHATGGLLAFGPITQGSNSCPSSK